MMGIIELLTFPTRPRMLNVCTTNELIRTRGQSRLCGHVRHALILILMMMSSMLFNLQLSTVWSIQSQTMYLLMRQWSRYLPNRQETSEKRCLQVRQDGCYLQLAKGQQSVR